MKVMNAAEINSAQEAGTIFTKTTKQDNSDNKKKTESHTNSEDEGRGVTLEISENLKEMYQQQLEAAKESAKAVGEGMQELAKIIEISRRISNGDKVPASDEKKLMEYDSGLYQAAKAAAMLHADEKHKEYSSLYEDEEDDKGQMMRDLRRESSGSGSGVGPESAGEVEVSVE